MREGRWEATWLTISGMSMATAHVDPSLRTTYTPEQLQQFFDNIKLPQKYRSSPVLSSQSAADTAEGLAFLTPLIRHTIAGIPWENLELHYSSHHTISIDPLHLFHKMIERKSGRGGYCMEITLLLATVMRSLGYAVMTTGARVNSAIQPISQSKSWTGPSYDGFNHMVTIVTIGRKKYLVDVGFGSNSPTFPVPLEDDYSALSIQPSHWMMLKRQHIPDNTHKTNPEQLLWVYSLRFTADMPWIPGYCFSDIEFLPKDFQTINFFVSQSPSSWFTYTVVCLKYLMDPETEEIVGDITLFGNEIKERRYGKSQELMAIRNESDRVDALEKFLGVTLSGPERNGIYGMVTMIM
jgi:arylamine N-acetyltransferase